MLALGLRRLGTALATLFLVTVAVFALVHLAPGGPLAEVMDSGDMRRLPADVEAELARLYHLDRPLPEQYLLWIDGVLRGDLGRSFRDRRPVTEILRDRLPVTLTLNGLALATMIALAVPLGALAAWRPGSRLDRAAALATYAGYALPAFWTALLLQVLVAVHLGWLPLAGMRSEEWASLGPAARVVDRARHLVLPVVCLSYGGLAYLSRFVRAALLDGAVAESVRAARARGLSELRVLVRHGFRQAAIPMLTLAGLLLPALVGGSVVIETVFALPGLGRLFVEAAFQRDVPVVLALTLVSGSATLAGMLLSDLAYAFADPRIRRRG